MEAILAFLPDTWQQNPKSGWIRNPSFSRATRQHEFTYPEYPLQNSIGPKLTQYPHMIPQYSAEGYKSSGRRRGLPLIGRIQLVFWNPKCNWTECSSETAALDHESSSIPRATANIRYRPYDGAKEMLNSFYLLVGMEVNVVDSS